MQSVRNIAKMMFTAAVHRADPARALRMQLEASPLPVPTNGRCSIVAIGKAAVPMMREALTLFPKVDDALVVTNPENYCELKGAKVITGSHPVPDTASVKAGSAVTGLLQSAEENDQVIALISGGGSSLMISPAADITVTEFGQLNDLLLASGLDINDINLIRQQVDDLKGGGMLRYAYPAEIWGYLLSDVIGDDLRAIASGPTVSPIGTRKDAIEKLQSARIWEKIPSSVQKHLATDSPVPHLPKVRNFLIGSNRSSLDAMLAAVPESYEARIACDTLIGDVDAAAQKILQMAKDIKGPTALIFGGETTVQLQGNGLGGRNQELALRVACAAEGRLKPGWVFLSGGTDGRDGPTESAGGLVDSGTVARIAKVNCSPDEFLKNNDSYTALKIAGDLFVTGSTGTNVADVQVFLRPAN